MTKVSPSRRAQSRSRRAAALLGVLGLFLMSAGLSLVVEGSATAAPAKVHKSYVCKYVTTPGGGEVLQTGQNPIWVANSSILGLPASGLAFVGETFKDGQIKSVVVIANTPRLHPEPSVSICAAPVTTGVTPGVVFSDSVCLDGAATNPSWAGANTADIDYAVTSGTVANGSTVTVTATPKTGFSFPVGATTTFTHTFSAAATNCVTRGNQVTSSAAAFQNPACPSNAVAANLGGSGFLSPAQWEAKGNFIDSNHITYTITGSFQPGGTVNVAASADTGYALTAGSATQWSHTFTAAADCNKVVPQQQTTIPKVIDSGFSATGFTPAGPNSALYTWGYSLAGAGAALFGTALVVGRRRRTVS